MSLLAAEIRRLLRNGLAERLTGRDVQALTVSVDPGMILKLLKDFMTKQPENETEPASGTVLTPADERGIAELVESLYPELRRLAGFQMRRERWDHTWQPTALVSELFLKLARNPATTWKSKSHFLMAASRAMRLLLIDYARSHNAQSNGGRLHRVIVENEQPGGPDATMEYLELDELIEQMGKVDKRMAEVVELKVFGGLSFGEIGEVLGVSDRTAKRDWQLARAWLFGHLGRSVGHDAGGMGTN